MEQNIQLNPKKDIIFTKDKYIILFHLDPFQDVQQLVSQIKQVFSQKAYTRRLVLSSDCIDIDDIEVHEVLVISDSVKTTKDIFSFFYSKYYTEVFRNGIVKLSSKW